MTRQTFFPFFLQLRFLFLHLFMTTLAVDMGGIFEGIQLGNLFGLVLLRRHAGAFKMTGLTFFNLHALDVWGLLVVFALPVMTDATVSLESFLVVLMGEINGSCLFGLVFGCLKDHFFRAVSLVFGGMKADESKAETSHDGYTSERFFQHTELLLLMIYNKYWLTKFIFYPTENTTVSLYGTTLYYSVVWKKSRKQWYP